MPNWAQEDRNSISSWVKDVQKIIKDVEDNKIFEKFQKLLKAEMSLNVVQVPLWWKAVGRHWLRKSSCCSLVPHRDHLRWKVLELQLCIASPSVSACWLRHSTTTVQLYCPGTNPLCFYTALYRASAFRKSKLFFLLFLCSTTFQSGLVSHLL